MKLMRQADPVLVSEDKSWIRLVGLSAVLFFVFLGDAILSDWVPAYMQESLGGPLIMGMVMSFSSIVGLGADLLLPQLMKHATSGRLMTMAIGASLIFSGILMWSIQWPVVLLFLIGMGVWGIYYEFLGFGSQQMVAETVRPSGRSGAWATIGIFKSLAYFLGPILGSWLAISQGNTQVVYFAAGFVVIGYVFWKMLKYVGKEEDKTQELGEKLNIVDEIDHWRVLLVHVWPILIISLVLGLVDATFWTTGTVLSDNLARQHWLGGMFLPFYMLPPVIVGVFLAKWGLKTGKKKMAEKFMLLGGVCLSLLGITDGIWLLLLASLATGIMLSVAWPMMEAVYSDIIFRMGRERKHMMGLSNSTTSIAYIIGPVSAGWLASMVGEKMTFVIVGVFTVVVSLVLLAVTPKKLRLPQGEIAEWKD